MQKSFDETWGELQKRLKPGEFIPNWTAHKGYKGDAMKIAQVHQDEVVVDSPTAKTLQHVSRQEFETIWPLWPDYKALRVQRQEIRDLTRSSRYIINILHWLESNTP
ncbi:MAG: hypothetical protein JW987_00565 [Anaerolineaceae bacterium]|nr:hypothetical protein [Anaerolineaceae bacterium]